MSGKEEGRTKINKDSLSRFSRRALLKRIIAIFVNFPEKPMRPIEIARSLDANPDSVRSIISRLNKKGIIKRVAKGFYQLNDKNKALSILEEKSVAIKVKSQGLCLGEFRFEEFLDIDSAVLEHSMISIRPHISIIRKLRQLGKKWSEKDKAQQVSIRGNGISLVVSKYTVRVYITSVTKAWPELIRILRNAGLSEGEIKLFLDLLTDKIRQNKARATVEIPVTSKIPDEVNFVIRTKVGDKELITRLSASHFPKELEISGHIDLVSNFISILAGVQHFSILEFIQANELIKINKKFGLLAQAFEQLAIALRENADRIREFIQAKQKEEKEDVSDMFT